MYFHNEDKGRQGIDNRQSDLTGGTLYSRHGSELSFSVVSQLKGEDTK